MTGTGDRVHSSSDSTVLREVHDILLTLTKRVAGTEKELKEIKRRVIVSTPVSSDSSGKHRLSGYEIIVMLTQLFAPFL